MRVRMLAILVAAALAPQAALAEITSIGGNASVQQGSKYVVRFEGEATGEDTIGFAEPGSDVLTYDFLSYDSPSGTEPLELHAPYKVGPYDIVLQADFETLARYRVEVVPATAWLSAPEAAAPGEFVDVSWTGPQGFDDEIRLAEVGAPVEAALAIGYLAGSPTLLHLPETPGQYEIRYIHGPSDEQSVLTAIPITVDGEAAYRVKLADAGGMVPLEVPASAQSRGPLVLTHGGVSSRWQARVVRPGTDEVLLGNPGSWSFVIGNPLNLEAPLEPGDYEVVLLDPDGLVRARQPLTVVPAVASVEMASFDAASRRLEVRWSGPEGGLDRIDVARVGAGPDERVGNFASVFTGSDATLRLPDAAGDYVIRYLQYIGGEPAYRILATAPLTLR